MEAVQETIRVPRCVEKRIPVTYTCTVPRVVCCRVPVDPCGVPLEGWVESGAASAVERQEPTPADRTPAGGAADATPAIDPEEPVPEAGEQQEPAAGAEAQPEGKAPAPPSEVYEGQST